MILTNANIVLNNEVVLGSLKLREYSIARSRSDLFEYSVEPKP